VMTWTFSPITITDCPAVNCKLPQCLQNAKRTGILFGFHQFRTESGKLNLPIALVASAEPPTGPAHRRARPDHAAIHGVSR